MDTALGDATTGIIKKLTDENADGLAKALKAVVDKFNGNGQTAVDISKDEYDKVKTEVGTITTAIDKALESDDLTQLDTANLKALKSSVLDLEKTFTSIEEMKLANNKYTVEVPDIAKVKESLGKLVKEREEVGASATKALASSKAQAENIKEMLLRVLA